jgi:chromate transport protein ChrA
MWNDKMKKRFSIIEKPYYLFYAFSLIGLITAWQIPFFWDFSKSFWIVTAPLIVGAYLQFSLKNKCEASDNENRTIGIFIVIGVLFATVVITVITILILLGVLYPPV